MKRLQFFLPSFTQLPPSTRCSLPSSYFDSIGCRRQRQRSAIGLDADQTEANQPDDMKRKEKKRKERKKERKKEKEK